MQRKFAITFNAESGVAQALRKYCKENGVPENKFIAETVAEKLRSIDVRSLSIAEIAEIEEIEEWIKQESELDLLQQIRK